MTVADLGADPRIAAILNEQGIEDLYPPQECADRAKWLSNA